MPAHDETYISAALKRGDLHEAVSQVLKLYGAELFSFLASAASDIDTAEEAFSRFCLDLWQGLDGFHGRSSVRTWCYVVARNALFRAHREAKRHDRELPLSRVPELQLLANQARTTTAMHLRTENRHKLNEVRAELDEEERCLVALRLDRRLSWNEISLILSGPSDSESQRRRNAARWRKRYERAKARLAKRMRPQGKIEPPSG